MEIVLWISRFAFQYVKEFTGSNTWSYKPEQVLFDYRKKLPVRLVLTEACGLCSVHCSSVLLQIFLWLLGGGLPAARGQWVPPQQKNRWCIFALSLWPHEAFLQPPWNLCRPLFLGLCVVCHWTSYKQIRLAFYKITIHEGGYGKYWKCYHNTKFNRQWWWGIFDFSSLIFDGYEIWWSLENEVFQRFLAFQGRTFSHFCTRSFFSSGRRRQGTFCNRKNRKKE